MSSQDPLALARRRRPIEYPEEHQPRRSPAHHKVERSCYIPKIVDPTRMDSHQSSLDTNGDGVTGLNGRLQDRAYYSRLFGWSCSHCTDTGCQLATQIGRSWRLTLRRYRRYCLPLYPMTCLGKSTSSTISLCELHWRRITRILRDHRQYRSCTSIEAAWLL